MCYGPGKLQTCVLPAQPHSKESISLPGVPKKVPGVELHWTEVTWLVPTNYRRQNDGIACNPLTPPKPHSPYEWQRGDSPRDS